MSNLPSGVLIEAPLYHFEQLDSTNAEAIRKAASGERGPLWIVADTQSAGKGRSNREWCSGEENFLASLLFAPAQPTYSDLPPLQAVAVIGFAVSLALIETAEAFVDSAHLTLKWPNDLLLDGKKLAGVLLETGGGSMTTPPDWLVIGVGVNIKSYPTHTDHLPATSLSEFNQDITAEMFRKRFIVYLEQWLRVWSQYGFSALRNPWLQRAARLGEEVIARTGNKTYRGIFETIDPMGALILQTDSEKITLPAADIYFSTLS